MLKLRDLPVELGDLFSSFLHHGQTFWFPFYTQFWLASFVTVLLSTLDLLTYSFMQNGSSPPMPSVSLLNAWRFGACFMVISAVSCATQ